MNRALFGPLLAAVALLLTACPPVPGTLVLDALPDGRYGDLYTGNLAVTDYSGPARFTLVAGNLPPGLAMDEAGAIEGVADYASRINLTVLVSDMRRVEDFQEVASFTITADNVEGAFLGYVHDQINNMTEDTGDRMRDIWVRPTGGGEEGFQSWTMNPGIYLPGPNGIPEGGQDDGLHDAYDDVRIGDLDFADLDVEFSGWDATEELATYPPDYPSQHTPEGEPPTVSSDGTVTSGSDTGGADLHLSHPVFGDLDTRVMVVPPDWCPNGEHVGGGPNNPGFCA